MQYIFLEDNYQTGHMLMSDIENMKNVHIVYKDKLIKNILFNNICRLYISKKINRIIKLPGKMLWYKYILNKIIDRKRPVCIVMISAWYDPHFIEWLKKNYCELSLVMILRDTVASNEKRDEYFSISQVSKEFDLVISYDKIYDVKKYGLTYAPVYMSKVNTINMAINKTIDLSLIALAKDRLDVIHSIYTKVKSEGVSTFFYLVGVDEKDSIDNTEIVYARNSMNSFECLKKELEANCILEVLKGDAHSNTLRFWEAIIYNRKLLTNWKGVMQSKYYNPQFIQYFENIEDINCDFIKNRENVDYNYQNELSPIHLIEMLDKIFL